MKALVALLFYPRGGSSHVTRSLARFMPCDVTLVSGSLGAPGDPTHAATFFEGIDVHAVDYTRALEAPDPLRADPPFHPSYEDRADAPDPVFAMIGDDDYEHAVSVWERELAAAGAAGADVLHLSHLTPMNEAAARSFADVPVVGHIHGTELLMLEEIEQGPPPSWVHAEAWGERMRRWAQACERVLVLSPGAQERTEQLLGVPAERIVMAPNGFDPEAFDRRPLDRAALWRDWLGTEIDGTVLVYVGRFTAVKRVPLLIRAHARARERFETRAPLVIVGGHPGEHEGEHPADVIAEVGAEDVHLAGWHGHDELPDALNASDVLVLPSVREGFGQVLVEAMACGVPVIAVNRHGPTAIVDPGETGWLVEPDDEEGMADALVEAVNDADERRRRAEAAYTVARERFSWPALAERIADVYEDAARRG